MRQVLLYHGEDGYWITECPSLPGCISQGKTKEEALNNIKEAIELFIEALKEEALLGILWVNDYSGILTKI